MTYDRGDAVGLMIKNKKGSPGKPTGLQRQPGPLAALRVIGLDVARICHSRQGMKRGWRGQRDQALRDRDSSGGNEEAFKVVKWSHVAH